MKWLIYLLFGSDGTPIYIGMTTNPKRRMKEHGSRLGFRPRYLVLEEGAGDLWRLAESDWINEFHARGIVLENRMAGGRGMASHSDETRRLLSVIGKGRAKPKGFGARLAKKTKGRPHDWSEEGRANAQKTQFKAGQSAFVNDAHRRSHLERLQRDWLRKSAEQRSIEATARNLAAWACRTPEERQAIGRRAAEARARNRAETAV